MMSCRPTWSTRWWHTARAYCAVQSGAGRTALHRVCAVRSAWRAGTDVDGPLVAVLARLVVVGADDMRLH